MLKKQDITKPHMVLLKDNRGNVDKVSFPQSVQVGLDNIPSELVINGSLSLSVGNYKCRLSGTVTIDDYHTICAIEPATSGTGSLYVKLPKKPRDGNLLVIKDLSGTAATNNIVISSWDVSTLIEDALSITISANYGFVSLFWKTNKWYIHANSGGTSSTGPQGPPGPQGPRGLDGSQGPRGLQGTAGVAGPQGPTGLTGLQGPAGTTGPRGLTGPRGFTGPQGAAGEDGLSAYGIWLNNGNSGTESDFLNSLQGPPGPQGEQGPAGLPGEVPEIVAGDNITITTSPEGAITISSAAGSAGAVSGVFYKKGTFAVSDIGADGILDFSSLGSLLPGYDEQTDVDIYLNGQLLLAGAGRDYCTLSATSLQFFSQLHPDDNIVVRIATAETAFEAGAGISISTSAGGVVTISSTSEVQDIIWNERLTGEVDGDNSVFYLSSVPSAPDTIMIFLNGLLQEQGPAADFTLSENAVTMFSPPQVGSKLTATYSK
jgi:hypothetical protein